MNFEIFLYAFIGCIAGIIIAEIVEKHPYFASILVLQIFLIFLKHYEKIKLTWELVFIPLYLIILSIIFLSLLFYLEGN